MLQLAIAPAQRSITYRFRDANMKIISHSSIPTSDDEAYLYAEMWEYSYIERCADVWPNHHAYSSWVALPWVLDVPAWTWRHVDDL